MQLSTLQVLVNSNIISEKSLDIIFCKNEKYYNDKEYYYKIEEVKKLDDSIYWLYFRYGSATPYCKDIIDIDSHRSTDNPRDIKQVEPRDQLFCIYHTKSNLLFVNNLKMKGRIQKFFQSQLNKVNSELLVSVDNVIIDINSVAQQLTSLNEVKLKYREDLLNSHVLSPLDMFPSPKELLGVSVNEQPDYTLSIKLHNAKVIDGFLDKFKKLMKRREDGELKDLVIIGKDSNLIDTIIRIDSITKKVSLDVKENEETKQYDPNQVKNEFMRNVKRVG